MSDAQYTGPLNFAVFALPRAARLTEIAAEIRELARGGRAEILDVELISRTAAGHAQLESLPHDLAPAETDLLRPDDLTTIAEDLDDDEMALVVVYEDRTLTALASSISAVAGRELWSGGIDAADLDTDNADVEVADPDAKN